MNRHISSLQFLFFVIYVILSFVMILTPILVTRSVHVKKLFIVDEDVLEAILLSFLFALSLLISTLYRKEASKQEEILNKIKHDKKSADEKLLDSISYIGKVNVQIEEIKSIFNTPDTFPETKNDFKKSARILGERVLGIVNTNWALFRIINIDNQRTIFECLQTRRGFSYNYPHVSNKMLVEKRSISSFTAVVSTPSSLSILICCAMPVETIDNDQRVFIQAILNEMVKLFIISNSSYHKEGNRKFAANGSTKGTMKKVKLVG
ncbi:MAG: hypothetical protein WBZ48_13770 [Bacteroidota bacterium]